MGPTECLITIFLIIVAILVISALNRDEQAKALEKARISYWDSLARLKAGPTNADLRQRTLELGRAYSYLTRNKQGVTVFDEVALMNDINAACAGAVSVSDASNRATVSQSIEERLEKLSDLKSRGLISEQEYVSKRQKILDEI